MDRLTVHSWYEQYKNGIYRYALSLTKDLHLAEDILHDTFVKALLAGHRVATEKAQAWLYRVVRNLCYDSLRRSKHEQKLPQAPANGEDPYAYIDLIASLSPKEQEIIPLKIVGRLTHGEIGSIVGITAKAAQKRYERAILQLREQED